MGVKKHFFIAILGLLVTSLTVSCSKDEPKKEPTSKPQTEEPVVGRDWLDGKTFEYIADLDKPAEKRMANDFTYVFAGGKVSVTHYMEDGYKTDRLYTVVRARVTGDYTYEKPVLKITNIKVTSSIQNYRDGKLISDEKKEENDEDFIIQVDEKEGALLFDEDWDPNRIPLKR